MRVYTTQAGDGRPQGDTDPRFYWLRVALVAATVIVTFLSALGLQRLAALLGVSRESLHGTSTRITPRTVALFMSFYALQLGLVCGVHRFVHRQRLERLRLHARFWPEFAAGFGLGLLLGGAEQVADVLLGSGASLHWAVPAGVGVGVVLAYYLFWFVIILTLNSLSEELTFRVYPLEHLVDRQHRPALVVALTALAFALVHHVLEPFSWRAFASRTLVGLLFGFAYHRYRSLWLLCGLHNGINFVVLSLSGNWQLGGLWALTSQPGPELLRTLARAVIWGGALLVLLRYGRAGGALASAVAGVPGRRAAAGMTGAGP